MVKPATARNRIVMEALNAQRGGLFAECGIYRWLLYFAGISFTESGRLTGG